VRRGAAQAQVMRSTSVGTEYCGRGRNDRRPPCSGINLTASTAARSVRCRCPPPRSSGVHATPRFGNCISTPRQRSSATSTRRILPPQSSRCATFNAGRPVTMLSPMNNPAGPNRGFRACSSDEGPYPSSARFVFFLPRRRACRRATHSEQTASATASCVFANGPSAGAEPLQTERPSMK
jgi:hypothetical protein